MADTIKIGNLDISAFKVGSDDCKVYLGDTLLYPLVEPSLKWKATYSDSSVTSAECGSSSEIVRYEIESNNLVSVEIGDCVITIGENAFFYSSLLTSIVIPDSVTNIGNGAFNSCSSLANITIPNSVTSIGNYAFQGDPLINVIMSNNVTSIGEGAFLSCGSLESITINATTPPTLGRYAFRNTNDCPIYVPTSSVDAYKSAWTAYASRIQAIPNS